MKLDYTIDEYLQNPLSNHEIDFLRKTERKCLILTCVIAAILVCIFSMVIHADMMIAAVIFIPIAFMGSMYIVEDKLNIKGVSVEGEHITGYGYLEFVELFPHHENVDVPEIGLFIKKIKEKKRPFAKFERDLIQILYLSAASKKVNELNLN